MTTCPHGTPLSAGCDDCIIGELADRIVQDEALIRQLVEALEKDRHDTGDWPEDSRNAVAALRARTLHHPQGRSKP